MTTFAERLKLAIEKRKLSQAEAARKCGVSQQTINYIIANNLNSSKLAPQIAAALGINSEWLIFGQGRYEENKVYELPILHSPYMVKKFIKSELDGNSLNYTVSNIYLDDLAFAYLLEAKKIVICSTKTINTQNVEYLNIENQNVYVGSRKSELFFPIFEWRIRVVDY